MLTAFTSEMDILVLKVRIHPICPVDCDHFFEVSWGAIKPVLDIKNVLRTSPDVPGIILEKKRKNRNFHDFHDFFDLRSGVEIRSSIYR